MNESYFSVSSELISTDSASGYDLFINSSQVEAREHFVRVHKRGDWLTPEDLRALIDKYHQLYVAESQRGLYLESITKSHRFSMLKKTEVMKTAAIQHLDSLFHPKKPFTTEVLNDTMAACRDTVSAMVDVVQGQDIETLQKHIAQLSFHDFYTYDHSINVSMYCISILNSLMPSATKDELITIGLGGLLHDLGKIKIPTHLLNKAGKLTDEEFEAIKKHPGFGMALLSENGVEAPKGVSPEMVKRIVFEHHENFNGSGYPNQLAGESIHLMARVTAIADFFDAITTKRSYHEAKPMTEALALMEKSKGKKLDPRLFDEFVKFITSLKADQLKAIPGELPDDFDPCQPHQELPLEKVKTARAQAGKVVNKKFDKTAFTQRPQTSKVFKKN